MPDMKRCAFCHKPANEVKSLIQGADGPDGAQICNRCIVAGAKALNREVSPTEEKERPIPNPREIKAFFDEYVISQERAKKDIAVAVYKHYRRLEAKKAGGLLATDSDLAKVEVEKSNILMLGPSGTGKTEIARTVTRMIGVPFYVADATKFTSAGYVGDDVESMIQGLIAAAGNDIERAEKGVIFIDEIDKIARKSGRGATGYRDVTGEGAQQAMLKIIEGDKVSVPRGMQKVGMGAASDIVDTTDILFICAGSFAGGIEDIVKDRVNKKAKMGFGNQAIRRDIKPEEIYAEAIEADVLEFGIIPELKGRLPVMTTTLPLTEEEMVRVLTEPKNAIVKQFKAQFAMDGIKLTFEDEALSAIGKMAKERPTGARALRGIMEDVLGRYVFDHAGDPQVTAIHITEAVVKDGSDAVVTRRSDDEPAPTPAMSTA